MKIIFVKDRLSVIMFIGSTIFTNFNKFHFQVSRGCHKFESEQTVETNGDHSCCI